MLKKASPSSIYVWIFLWLSFVACFLIYKTADASTYETANSSSTSARLRPVGVVTKGICQAFSYPQTLSISSLGAVLSTGSGEVTPYFYMSGGFSSEAEAVSNAPTSTLGNLWNNGNMGSATSTPHLLEVSTSTPVIIQGGTWNIVCFNSTGGTSGVAEYIWGSSSGSGAYAFGGSLLDSLNSVYVKLTGSAVDSISITSPANATTTNEFSNWGLSVSQATSTTSTSTDYYVKRIYVGASTSTMTIYAGGSNENPSGGSLSVYKPNPLGLGTWYAYAQLIYVSEVFNESSPIVATSSVISFTINAGLGASGYWGTPTSTASSSDWTITCDSTSGVFSNSLCNLANFLFIPNSESVSLFTSLGDLIKNKPPVGYFYAVQNSFDSFNSSASSSLTFVDLSNMEGGFFTLIKSSLSILLWVVAGFYLYNRINHLIL